MYFIPGTVAALMFLSTYTLVTEISQIFSFVGNIPLIGSFLLEGISQTFGLINVLIMQLYVFFVLTILSPFNTLLSEALDSQLTGKKYSFSISQVISDFLRMVLIVIVSLSIEFFLMGIWWIISWFVPFAFIDKIVYTVITAFFFGFSFYDYNLERYKQGPMNSLKYVWKNKITTILTGLTFLFIYYIPFIGVLFAPVITTMVATVVYLKNQNLLSQK